MSHNPISTILAYKSYKQWKRSAHNHLGRSRTVMQDGKCRHWGHKFRGWEEKPPKHNIYCLLRIPFYFPTFACPWALPVWYSLSTAGLPVSTHKLWLTGWGILPCPTSDTKPRSCLLSLMPKIRLQWQAIKTPLDTHTADEYSLKVNTQHSYHSSHTGEDGEPPPGSNTSLNSRWATLCCAR